MRIFITFVNDLNFLNDFLQSKHCTSRDRLVTIDPFLSPSLMRTGYALLAFAFLSLATPVAAKDSSDSIFAQYLGRGVKYLQDKHVLSENVIPALPVSRANFVEVVTKVVYPKDMDNNCFGDITSNPKKGFTKLFSDVGIDSPYAQTLCTAIKTGIVSGYRDGSFKPNNSIQIGEASKILYKAYAVGPLDRKGLPTHPWYDQPIYDLKMGGVLPPVLYDRPSKPVTVEAMGELMYRLKDVADGLQLRQNLNANGTIQLLGTGEMPLPVMNIGVSPTVTVHARGIDMVIPRPLHQR